MYFYDGINHLNTGAIEHFVNSTPVREVIL